MRTSPRFIAPLTLSTLMLASCGPTDGQPTSPFAATLNYIRANGFPTLASLMPALPGQLARVSGVETDASGLPAIPDDFGGATFGDSTAAVNGVLADAKQLSAQGFSESRRLEAMVHNLASPIYDLMGRSDLFTGAATAATDATTGEAIMLQDGSVGSAVTSLFDGLQDALTYAINTGGQDGMPAYIVLSGNAEIEGIDIAGLWPSQNNFSTGFHASVRLNALDDLDVSLTLSPALVAGLVPSWKAQSCADDLWNVSITSLPSGEKSLEVKNNECPGTRNALSTLTFASNPEGSWGLRGGFAQSFPDADPDTLRGWLGTRQGFVVQAAASADLDRLAAAAAVLGEPEFAAPSQSAIDEFGVGQLVARYFQAKYFNPRRQEAKDDFIPDPSNAAYWTCFAPGVSTGIKNEVAAAKKLCNGEEIDVESTLAALVSLNDGIKNQSLAPTKLKTTVKTLVDILTIRNTLFVGGDADLAYKVAPDEAFASLDENRKSSLPAALSDASWKDGASSLLKPVLASEIPDTPYKALTNGLSNFLKKQCAALVGDSAAKAGKSSNAAGVCG